MAKVLAQRYEMQTKGPTVDDTILAHVALQRGIAEPLCDKPNTKGGDTRFWKKVNKKLKQLAWEHGEDLQSPSWKTWRESVIQADREKYTGMDMTLVDLDEEPEQEHDGSEVE
ncbi:hypothetical protein EDD85DRAFT_792674 [Armillaria nabsnona]|nr:hypothetical protein EDD85DRAFT_792674 [Armillaria nabsnona]